VIAPRRRTVLKGFAATCGAGLLAGCGGTGEPPPAREDGALASLADIPVGEAVAATAPDGTKVLVAQPAEGQAVAFSSICTHQGCTVPPDGACPCHGSMFDPLTGEVRQGPAEQPLKPYAVQVVDGEVRPA